MKNKILIYFLPLVLFIFGCESESGPDYKPSYYVEAVLLVDQPFTNIKVFKAVPINTKYSHNEAIIKDATIRIFNNEIDIQLEYVEAERSYYEYPDENLKVKENTSYNLEITLADGRKITGQTTTPLSFEWVNPPAEEVQFPLDTLKQPAAPKEFDLEWTESNTNYYLLTVRNLDTLEYGKYLDPPTEEKNRRCYSLFRDSEEYYNEISTTNPIGGIKTPIVWLAFKWFGLNEISVYSPDKNYLDWFVQMASWGGPYHDPNLDSVEGEDAIGVFGSAAVIKGNMFLLKNQP